MNGGNSERRVKPPISNELEDEMNNDEIVNVMNKALESMPESLANKLQAVEYCSEIEKEMHGEE